MRKSMKRVRMRRTLRTTKCRVRRTTNKQRMGCRSRRTRGGTSNSNKRKRDSGDSDNGNPKKRRNNTNSDTNKNEPTNGKDDYIQEMNNNEKKIKKKVRHNGAEVYVENDTIVPKSHKKMDGNDKTTNNKNDVRYKIKNRLRPDGTTVPEMVAITNGDF